MMLLDNEKLQALEDEFNDKPQGLNLRQFILLMKNAIDVPKKDKYDFVNGLNKLFNDIDINGDGDMEWKEFTQYIIDAVIGNAEQAQFEGSKPTTTAQNQLIIR